MVNRLIYVYRCWYTYPSEKYEFVSWDDEDLPIYAKNMFQTTNQFNSVAF